LLWELVGLFYVVLSFALCCFLVEIMVEQIKCVVSKYQQRLMEMPLVPRSSFGRASLGKDSEANKLFLTYLFSDMDLGFQFLKDAGLIHSKVMCNTCGRVMTWCADPKRDGFRWRCRSRSVVMCSESKSINMVHGLSILTSLSHI
jgi:hypothetical protein